jgi:hypothetical protein
VCHPRGIEADEPLYVIKRHGTGNLEHEGMHDDRNRSQSQQSYGNGANPTESLIFRQTLPFLVDYVFKLQKATRFSRFPQRFAPVENRTLVIGRISWIFGSVR